MGLCEEQLLLLSVVMALVLAELVSRRSAFVTTLLYMVKIINLKNNLKFYLKLSNFTLSSIKL